MLKRVTQLCASQSLSILRAMSTGAPAQQGPVYRGIVAALEKTLEPTHLSLVDDSAKHSSHAAMRQADQQGKTVVESHFKLEVVSQKFEGLSRVKRHQLVRLGPSICSLRS